MMRELVEVLAEHLGLKDLYTCKCGESIEIEGPLAKAHAEHVADAVLAHLREVAADEGVRERWLQRTRFRIEGDTIWIDAETALTAFLDALSGAA